MPMVRLHLLGFTPDLKGLVFSGRRGGRAGTYWVPVDDSLNLALEQLESAREDAHGPKDRRVAGRVEPGPEDELEPEPEPEPETEPAPAPRKKVESRLSPREIQTLLREGRSVRDVAQRAGVDEAWVERFMGPVLEEMSGIIQLTQRAHQSRPRLGLSGVPVGDAVLRNLEDRRATADTLESLASGWDARRVGRGNWRVRLRFQHRGKRRVAEWELDGDTRAVRSRNQLAADIGWRAARSAQRLPSEPVEPPGAGIVGADSEPEAEPAPAAPRRAPARRATKRKTATGRATGTKKPARRAASTKRAATTKRTAKRTTSPKRAPAKAKAKTTARQSTSARGGTRSRA